MPDQRYRTMADRSVASRIESQAFNARRRSSPNEIPTIGADWTTQFMHTSADATRTSRAAVMPRSLRPSVVAVRLLDDGS